MLVNVVVETRKAKQQINCRIQKSQGPSPFLAEEVHSLSLSLSLSLPFFPFSIALSKYRVFFRNEVGDVWCRWCGCVGVTKTSAVKMTCTGASKPGAGNKKVVKPFGAALWFQGLSKNEKERSAKRKELRRKQNEEEEKEEEPKEEGNKTRR